MIKPDGRAVGRGRESTACCVPRESASIAEACRWARRRHEALKVMIELSIRCNLRCVHCYNIDRNNPRRNAPEGELTTADILALLPALRAEGCLYLGLTGGEIFVHPGLFEIIDHAGRLGMAVRPLSNGTLLPGDTVSRLAALSNVLGVDLSLYGASPAVHDAITRVPGSFDRTWTAAKALHEAGLLGSLKYVVMKSNAHETAAMVEQARSSGFAFGLSTSVFPRLDGTKGSLAERLDPEELERLYRGPLRYQIPSGTPKKSASDFIGDHARSSCGISARGDVYPCLTIPLSAGNVRRQPFPEIWRNSPLFRWIRKLRMADFPSCSGCADRPWCKHPRCTSYLVSGSYTGIDPWICEDARIVRRISEEGSEIQSVATGSRGLRARVPRRALKGATTEERRPLTP